MLDYGFERQEDWSEVIALVGAAFCLEQGFSSAEATWGGGDERVEENVRVLNLLVLRN